MSSDRRGFLRRAGLVVAAGAGMPSLVRASDVAREGGDAVPRHIIHLVADGTSSGTLTLGDYYSRMTRGRGLRWLELYRNPASQVALMNMRSLNSIVTDSAAASSSWGSGSRVKNGMLNILPDGQTLRPLYRLFDEAKWHRGLVTTTEITHATPAGFAVNAARESAEAIAVQYLASKVQVLLGGGQKYFDRAQRKDKRDLYADFRAAGYNVMLDKAGLESASAEAPWLGTFYGGHLPFTIDHTADSKLLKQVPTLAEMARAAIRKLSRQDRFILQIEGGRVDHAAHSNDIASAVRELVAFDEAVEVCLEFQAREPDTLLVITTDHGTGNAGLNSSGGSYSDSSQPLFDNVRKAKASFEVMSKQLGSNPAAGKLQSIVLESTGFKVPDRKAAYLASFYEKKGLTMYDVMNSVSSQMGQLMANRYGVGWTSGEHTADFVPLLALGPGSARFRGFVENTDVFANYLALAGIDFRNPHAPLMAECSPSATDVENLA